ncbi:MAG: YcxB family protein [Chloroflexi bacterium]|nr:MAG: YcxB family protein [Chloroflexota bacterium]TMG51663.1 MAG: YcxB family protein [Chloroflexota bacterium]
MEFRAKVVYERDVISEAARRFVFRSIRWDGFAVFFALVAALGYLLATGDRSWIVGFVAAVVLLMAIFGVALYVVPYRRSLARFERMSAKTAELSFTETGVRMTSDLGQQEFRWQLIDRVWTYPRVWLLFVADTYMTLPPANLDQETKTFVLDRIKLHGGRIN